MWCVGALQSCTLPVCVTHMWVFPHGAKFITSIPTYFNLLCNYTHKPCAWNQHNTIYHHTAVCKWTADWQHVWWRLTSGFTGHSPNGVYAPLEGPFQKSVSEGYMKSLQASEFRLWSRDLGLRALVTHFEANGCFFKLPFALFLVVIKNVL